MQGGIRLLALCNDAYDNRALVRKSFEFFSPDFSGVTFSLLSYCNFTGRLAHSIIATGTKN